MQAASRWASRKQAKILRNLSGPAPAVKRCVSIPRGDTVQAKILDFGLARLTPAGAGLPPDFAPGPPLDHAPGRGAKANGEPAPSIARDGGPGLAGCRRTGR